MRVLAVCPGQVRKGNQRTQRRLHKSAISAEVGGGGRGVLEGGITGLRCVWLAVPSALRVRGFREKQIIALPQVRPS